MKKLVLIAATALMMASCEKFLTPDNKSAVTDVDFFTTPSGLQSLVYDSYAQIPDIWNNGSAPDYFNAGTDLYGDGRSDNNTALHRWQNFTPENGTVKTIWTECYDAIRSCYSIQYYADMADTIDDAVKAKAIDEGRFVAALHYYLLVCNYGGVPLVTEYASTAVKGYPRATAEETYQYIIDELKDIISRNNLKATTATAGGGEASIEAAKALLAKTYLAAAWDLNNTQYYTEAVNMANEVINASAAKGLPTEFGALWAADRSGDDNAEFIFDVEYEQSVANDVNSGSRWQSMYSNYYGGREEGMKNGGSSYIPTLRALSLFSKEDKRFDATFMRVMLTTVDWKEAGCMTLFKVGDDPIGDYFGYYDIGTGGKNGMEDVTGRHVGVYYPAPWETLDDIKAWRAQDPDHRTNTFVIPQQAKTWSMRVWASYLEGEVVNGETVGKYDPDKEGYYDYELAVRNDWSTMPVRKFDDEGYRNYDAGRSHRDIHIISLPEMYFVVAEAYAAQNQGAQAAAALNVVRQRAGLSDLATATIDDVLDESAREMYGNGYRRMDLRRTGKLVEYNNLWNPQLRGNAASAIGQKLLWPIPQSAIDQNDQLSAEDQNPGY